MDIQEATLIKRILNALTGTTGMQVRRLASQCQASPRRVNHLMLHLQNIGLIDIDEQGTASLSDNLADQSIRHVLGVEQGGNSFPIKSLWNGMHQAVSRQLAYVEEQRLKRAKSEAGAEFFSFLFGDSK